MNKSHVLNLAAVHHVKRVGPAQVYKGCVRDLRAAGNYEILDPTQRNEGCVRDGQMDINMSSVGIPRKCIKAEFVSLWQYLMITVCSLHAHRREYKRNPNRHIYRCSPHTNRPPLVTR